MKSRPPIPDGHFPQCAFEYSILTLCQYVLFVKKKIYIYIYIISRGFEFALFDIVLMLIRTLLFADLSGGHTKHKHLDSTGISARVEVCYQMDSSGKVKVNFIYIYYYIYILASQLLFQVPKIAL